MNEAPHINIEVACALPEKQKIVQIAVPEGTSARTALALSGIAEYFPGVDAKNCPLGVFGSEVSENYLLKEGDRVEIYRPLPNDPREQRRRLASKGMNMGQKSQAED